MTDERKAAKPFRPKLELVVQVAGMIAANFQKGGRAMSHKAVANDCVDLALEVIKASEVRIAEIAASEARLAETPS